MKKDVHPKILEFRRPYNSAWKAAMLAATQSSIALLGAKVEWCYNKLSVELNLVISRINSYYLYATKLAMFYIPNCQTGHLSQITSAFIQMMGSCNPKILCTSSAR